MNELDQVAIQNFREYLQIPSVQPDVDYTDCLNFIKKQADSLGLLMQIHHVKPNKPVAILSWLGQNKALPSLLLNSHMDVVPVFEDKWSKKPFGAEVVEGKIYARGAQDMKSIGIQYLEAIRRLKLQNITPKRTVHISFVPDEEIGGLDGMGAFVHTKAFKDLNVGIALDEGIPSPDDNFILTYAERTCRTLHIHSKGTSGHGSLFIQNTAAEKLVHVLNKVYEYRREMEKIVKEKNLWFADVTTVNLTVLKGGVQRNVVPSEFEATVDCRVAVTEDFKKFDAMLNEWCKSAGDDITITYEDKYDPIPPTKLDDNNDFWIAFKKAIAEMKLKLKPLVMPGRTDGNFIRAFGIPVFGFSPMINTPPLLHAHDEYIATDVFLKGIEIYCKVIVALTNV